MRMMKKLPIQILAGLATCAFLFAVTGLAQDAAKAKEQFNQAVATSDAVEAEKLYKAAIDSDPSFVDSYINLGALYFKGQKYDEAANMFKQATEKAPTNAEAFANLGRVHYMLERWTEAEAAFSTALKNNAGNGELLKELGKVYLKKGKDSYPQMIETLEQCHTTGAGDNITYYMLGRGYNGTGDNTKAIAAYKKSIELDASYYNAHSALGQIYLSQQKFDLAATEFEKSMKLDPSNSKAAYNFAIAVESDDPENYEKNIEVWEKYISIARKNPQAKRELAVAEAHVKELKDAHQQAGLQ